MTRAIYEKHEGREKFGVSGTLHCWRMQPSHDRYCDEGHTPRQACNDALAPDDMRASDPVEPMASDAEPVGVTEPEDPPMPSAVREAIAIAQMAPTTRYVTREWERTAAAVSGVADADEAPCADGRSRGGRVVRAIALVGAVVAVIVIVLRVRGRRAGDG